MNLFLKDNTRVAFLTKRSIIKDLKEPINIILSPEYYWVKKVKLPVANIFQAKKYAPAIFEDHLPSGTKYEYIVLKAKAKNEFIVMAYSRKIILGALKKQLNDTTQIKGIYWSQIELSDLETCVSIDTNGSLAKIDEMILYLPQDCVKPKETLYEVISKSPRSNNYLKLNSLTHDSIPKPLAYKFIASALFLISAFGIDFAVHQYKINQASQRIAQIKEEYHMPKTSFELKSIQSRLGKIDKKQKDLRALLKIVEDIPLKGKNALQSLSFDKKTVELTINLNSQKDKSTIQKYLSKNATLLNENLEDLKYTVALTHG